MPRPPALSTSRTTSEFGVSSRPVYNVNTSETSNSAWGRRLFGPLYGARKAGCPWPITLICPESQYRSVAEWPSRVLVESWSEGRWVCEDDWAQALKAPNRRDKAK